MANSIEAALAKINRPVRQRLTKLFGAQKRPFEVYGLLSEFLSIEGKLLRPALCTVSCSAVGGKPEDALHAAAAIEMFHNFTLIHDDIEDCSLLRRGKPCMHMKYGVPLALNAGDGLFMMVWKEAMELQHPKKEAALQQLLAGFTQVLEGQAIELGWYNAKKWDVTEEDYFRVVEGKTGALIATACEVGGILGSGSAEQRRALSDFGFGIGVGFQIADDVLNIVGDEKKYGKEIGGDILEGKRTLITIRAQAMLSGKEKSRLGWLLRKEKKSRRDVSEIIGLLKDSGAVASAMKTADRRIATAKARLKVLPKTPARQVLYELADYITKREK
ncbi:MAG: polyprenyl synthetase family protein [Candidatus Anstonellaceae archaeon]